MIEFLDVSAGIEELRGELSAALAEVVDSGWFVLGTQTEAFEEEYARYCGARAAVGVGSGLDALELALRAVGVTGGDEVIVPSHTFIATWLAVHATGARIVPVEPTSAWSGLDVDAVCAALSPRTAAIVAVDMHGHPSDIPALARVARAAGVALVEDAAQSHGATIGDAVVGSLCDVTAFSFYPAKNLGALGDGGAVVTQDPAVARRVRELRNYGGVERYEHHRIARNSRLDEMQAAVLRVKLQHLDEWNARRRVLAERYSHGLQPLVEAGTLRVPEVTVGSTPSWHLYSVLIADRDRMREKLTAASIATGVHYPVPPHRTPAFAELGFRADSYPIANQIAETTLSLPIGPHATAEEVDQVTRALVDGAST